MDVQTLDEARICRVCNGLGFVVGLVELVNLSGVQTEVHSPMVCRACDGQGLVGHAERHARQAPGTA